MALIVTLLGCLIGSLSCSVGILWAALLGVNWGYWLLLCWVTSAEYGYEYGKVPLWVSLGYA